MVGFLEIKYSGREILSFPKENNLKVYLDQVLLDFS